MRRKIYGILSLLMAFVLLMAGCKTNTDIDPVNSNDPDDTSYLTEIRIPYDAQDSLNPFACTTIQNYYVCRLLFDSLVRIDPTDGMKLSLASNISEDSVRWTVTIRNGARFSDGSLVTSEDIRYSCLLAMNCKNYRNQLSNVTEIQTPDRMTVVFILNSRDQYFDRSLNFPIIKAEEYEEGNAVGGGRYIYSDENDVLIKNPFFPATDGNVSAVYLVNAADIETQSEYLMTGDIDVMYIDPSGGLRSSLGSTYRQIQLNNLVFIGVNSSRQGLDNKMRTIISNLIDREDIARTGYFGFAMTSTGIIQPTFGDINTAFASVSKTANEIEKELDQIGMSERDDDGWRLKNGSMYTLSILAPNSSNSKIELAEALELKLKGVGIKAKVETCDYYAYLERVSSGDYDLFIGETKISPNMNLSALLMPSSLSGSGCAYNEELVKVYNDLKNGDASLNDFNTKFVEILPVIPVVYRRAAVCFSKDFSTNIIATEYDFFYNIDEW